MFEYSPEHYLKPNEGDFGGYAKAISDLGLTEADVRGMSERTEDVLPDLINGIQIKDSLIEGLGTFATTEIAAQERIGPARLKNARTIISRYTNHSDDPNAVPVVTDEGVDLMALKPISEGEEITVDYRHAACAHTIANNQFLPTRKGEIAETLLAAMRKGYETGELIELEDQLEHYHPKGLYGRRQTLNAGSTVVGKVHRRESLTMVLKGTLVIVDEVGNRKTHTAPDVWITPVGTQRVIHAITDAEWIGVWPTDLKEIDEIEQELTCMSMDEFNCLSLEN